MTDKKPANVVENATAVPQEAPAETAAEAPKKEAPKVKLPKGLTQEMVDAFKAAWPKVGMARVAGIKVVTRPLTREEYVTLRESSKSEDALNEAIIQKAMLWHEDLSATSASGFRSGLISTIAEMSDVRDAPLFLVDEDMVARWPEIMKDYPEDKRFDIVPFAEKYEVLWAMVTDDQIYLVTYVSKVDYDHVSANAADQLDDRMIQHGLIYPRMGSFDLKRLSYGRYQTLLNNMMITSGFNPEPAVIL